uniref:Uncharacterized protein n=1 Tax=Parascaris univalens TaxID=6257 RepID=A0A915A9C6_PARUN
MNFEIYNDSIAERKILTINFATVLTTSGSIEGTECRQRVLSDSRLSTRIYKSTSKIEVVYVRTPWLKHVWNQGHTIGQKTELYELQT